MRYPKAINKGDTIGFPAPSFGCAQEPYRSAFTHALETFQGRGFGVKPGPNAYADLGVGISNTPEKCGQELTQMYLDTETSALISCGGGELMCEVLDYVNFPAIAQAEPKWYMGYSDNTNMTFLLTTLCDTAAVYGPCAPAFGMEPWHPSLEEAFALLQGKQNTLTGYEMYEMESLKDEEHPLEPYHVTVPRHIHAWPQEDASYAFSGRLIGGCMDCLVNLTGTMYDQVAHFSKRYAQDGLIWFLESCDLSVFGMRRAIWNMQHAGWFSHVKGFLIGRPLHHGEEIMGLDQYAAVTELLKTYEVPIIMDLDIGHLPPMMPLVSGSLATVEYHNQQLSIRMDLV